MRMKIGLLAFGIALLLSAPVLSFGQSSPPGLALRGIVSWPGHEVALLEHTNTNPWERNLVLKSGEVSSGIEVLQIKDGMVKVRVQNGSGEVQLSLPRTGSPVAAPGPAAASIQLEGANLDLVFRVYQQIADRTVLRPWNLPAAILTVPGTNFTTTDDLLKALDKTLVARGVLMRPDREKFVLAVANNADFQNVTPELWNAASRLAGESSTPKEERLDRGIINFPSTDLNQVLVVFQELANRTVIRASTLPSPSICLRTQTPLSRAEAIYAFSAVLALNGLSFTEAGDRFLLVYPSFQKDRVAELLARTKLKRSDDSRAEESKTTLRFPHAELHSVVDLYKDLSGQKVEVAPQTPRLVLNFNAVAPLTKNEALYGMELLFRINGLSLVPLDDASGVIIKPTAKVK